MSIDYMTSLFFGKLPLYRDFVRHNASSNEVIAFDQWLQQGIQSSKTPLNVHWNSAFDQSSPYYFHYYLNSQQSLIGMWQPSMDSAGRRFPFVIAAIVNGSDLDKHIYTLVPSGLKNFFSTARQIYQDACSGAELVQLAQRTENLNSDKSFELTGYQNYLSNTALESYFTALWGSFSNSNKYLLLTNLSEILLPLRNQDFSRFSLGLKFPLSQHFEANFMIASFWLDVTARLLADNLGTPYYFWSMPFNDKPASLFLFFRIPPARNFVDLIGTDSASDNICELDQEGKENIDRVMQSLPDQYRALIETSDLTLRQFLDML